jgi:chorismate--pyruvate lyase
VTRNYWLQNHAHIRWRHANPALSSQVSDNTLSWLNHKESLTARLKQHCAHFQVELLFEDAGQADEHEASLLALNLTDNFWTREVYLFGDGQPWVYARSLMPSDHSGEQLKQIKQLKQKPLGEMLFSGNNLTIESRFIAEFPLTNTLNPNNRADISSLWGRRTLFRVNRFPLIISEIFLPDAPAYR